LENISGTCDGALIEEFHNTIAVSDTTTCHLDGKEFNKGQMVAGYHVNLGEVNFKMEASEVEADVDSISHGEGASKCLKDVKLPIMPLDSSVSFEDIESKVIDVSLNDKRFEASNKNNEENVTDALNSPLSHVNDIIQNADPHVKSNGNDFYLSSPAMPQAFHLTSPSACSKKGAILSLGASVAMWQKKWDWVKQSPFPKMHVNFTQYQRPSSHPFLHRLAYMNKKALAWRDVESSYEKFLFCPVYQDDLVNEEVLMDEVKCLVETSPTQIISEPRGKGKPKSSKYLPVNNKQKLKLENKELSQRVHDLNENRHRFMEWNGTSAETFIMMNNEQENSAPKISLLHAENFDLSTKNQELTSMNNDLELKYKEALTTIEELRVILAAKTSEFLQLEAENKALKAEKDKLTLKNHELLSRNVGLQTLYDQAMSRNRQLVTSVQQQQVHDKHWQNQNKLEETTNIKQLQETLARVEKENMDLRFNLWKSRVDEAEMQ